MLKIRGCLLALVIAAAIPPAIRAAEKADATLTLEAKSVALGVGWSWGSGVLDFGGKKQRFKVEGLAVNAAGVEKVGATGYVYNLKKLEDFPGTYTAIEAGGAAGGGAGIARMRNSKGVDITLHTTSQGLAAHAGPEGMTITLE